MKAQKTTITNVTYVKNHNHFKVEYTKSYGFGSIETFGYEDISFWTMLEFIHDIADVKPNGDFYEAGEYRGNTADMPIHHMDIYSGNDGRCFWENCLDHHMAKVKKGECMSRPNPIENMCRLSWALNK